MDLPKGPLAFGSGKRGESLTVDEEALLAFAAVGITGRALGEMDYTSGSPNAGGGNILGGFIGRTAASADALQSVGLVVISDNGTWYVPRPQDLTSGLLADLAKRVDQRAITDWYTQIRVAIDPKRVTIPSEMPFTPAFNQWDTNKPGTTVFLPIIETTAIIINCLLTALSEEMGICIMEDGIDRSGTPLNFPPAGLGAFARTTPGGPGHLRLDTTEIGFAVPMTFFETTLLQAVSAEMGGVLQNLGLMAQALGLGGFVHSAQHPLWLHVLGFQSVLTDFVEMMAVGPIDVEKVAAMGFTAGVPTFHGHTKASNDPNDPNSRFPRSFCPPQYASMSDAVNAFIETKYGKNGVFTGGVPTAWKDTASIENGISPYSDNAIAATKTYCEYVHAKYRRFPTLHVGPLSTLLAHQAHHLDADFYGRFYQPGVLP